MSTAAELSTAAAANHCVAVLDRLRLLQESVGDLLDEDAAPPPEGWTREELQTLKWLAATFHARLFIAAPAEVQDAYLRQQVAIERRGV